MATGRMLKKNISESRRLSELKTDSARMLWTWIIPYLDVEGRFYAAPDMIKGKVVPRLKTFNEENIREYLQDMARVGLIILYQHDGDDYLQYRNFKEFQTLQPKKEGKPLPAPDKSNTTPQPLQEDSESSPPQFNLNQSNLKEAKETPAELPPVDNSPAEEKPQPVKNAFFSEMEKEFSEVMTAIKTKYNHREIIEVERWIINNHKGKHPQALIHTLNSIVKIPGKPDISITLYLDKVIKIENVKYNYADFLKKEEEFKKPGMFSIGDIFKGIQLRSQPAAAH